MLPEKGARIRTVAWLLRLPVQPPVMAGRSWRALHRIFSRLRISATKDSTAVNRDAKSLLHADSRNLKESDNFAASFGNFMKGQLAQGRRPREGQR